MMIMKSVLQPAITSFALLLLLLLLLSVTTIKAVLVSTKTTYRRPYGTKGQTKIVVEPNKSVEFNCKNGDKCCFERKQDWMVITGGYNFNDATTNGGLYFDYCSKDRTRLMQCIGKGINDRSCRLRCDANCNVKVNGEELLILRLDDIFIDSNNVQFSSMGTCYDLVKRRCINNTKTKCRKKTRIRRCARRVVRERCRPFKENKRQKIIDRAIKKCGF